MRKFCSYAAVDAPTEPFLHDDDDDKSLDAELDVNRTERSRSPSPTSHWPSSPVGGTTEATDRAVPPAKAPAAAGHAHDVPAAHGETFGACSSTLKVRRRKERRSSSSCGTNPVCDKRLSLNSLGEGSVHAQHGPQDPGHTVNLTEAVSNSLDTGHAINTERDCGRPSWLMGDEQQQEPTRSTPTANLPSSKRAIPPAEYHAPSHKRLRSPSEHKGEALQHKFPLHLEAKHWGVVDLGRIFVGEDGSLSCELLWEPTTVLVSSLEGALLKLAEEAVKRDHGADTWDKWLMKQDKPSRRRGRGGNSSRWK